MFGGKFNFYYQANVSGFEIIFTSVRGFDRYQEGRSVESRLLFIDGFYVLDKLEGEGKVSFIH
jgi:hypothetical protein